MNNSKTESWATKYRPKTLEAMVGQEQATSQLKGMFKTKRYPKALLIYGPTGCGKSTAARIIASEIIGGPSDRNPDVTEINVGDSRGIDSIREIVGSTKFLGIGKFRIIILEEVHQLTSQGASALLRPLEDPPPHIIWILVTDQPQKLLPTIQNRCVKIELKMLTPPLVMPLLKRVCKKEHLDVPKQILRKLAEATGGQPRDSLQMLQSVADSMEGGINPKKALQEAINNICEEGVDAVAIRSLVYIYLGKADKFIIASSKATDQTALLNKLLELNLYFMNISLGIKDWSNAIKVKFINTMKENMKEAPDLKDILKVHTCLSKVKQGMVSYSVNEIHLIRSEIGSLCLKKGK